MEFTETFYRFNNNIIVIILPHYLVKLVFTLRGQNKV